VEVWSVCALCGVFGESGIQGALRSEAVMLELKKDDFIIV
jgi:hypothetical protein